MERKKRESTLQVLFKVGRLLNEEAIERKNASSPEHRPLRPSHSSLLPHLDLEGTRITVLAERMGISKQAVGQLVDDLEEWGLLRRDPDPEDGRAKLVRFTQRGREGILEGLELLGAMERELQEVVGSDAMLQMRRTLTVLLSSLEERR